jgi:predicted NBD/HSP70 family sugar kinase
MSFFGKDHEKGKVVHMSNEVESLEFAHIGGAKGSNQTSLRAYNERLVLSLVRRFGSLAKADIARSTGLSAQTVSVIMRGLESDGLLLRGLPSKGKVGQPSIPMSLNPRGAYFIGLKVGRRTADLFLIDFLGNILLRFHRAYEFAAPDEVLEFTKSGTDRIIEFLSPEEHQRVCGIGVATPFEMWNWADELGLPQIDLDAWRSFDLTAEIAKIVPYPVFIQNDATSACGAELVFGKGTKYTDFAYFYIGSFVGGGVVLNGNLYPGRTGYAGAMGPMPVPADDGTEQLIRHASLYVLEKMMAAAGKDPLMLTRQAESWDNMGKILDDWIDLTAGSLAHAALAAVSVLDFEAVIIDGSFPPDVRRKLVKKTVEHFAKLDSRGIAPLAIVEGALGGDARALGAASLPLVARYLLDLNAVYKEAI